MRATMIGILTTTMLTGAALAQSQQEVIDNRPVVGVEAPTATMTPEERARRYSTSDNEAVITEAQPGRVDGVPDGRSPVRPHTEGENAVVDEKLGVEDGADYLPRNRAAGPMRPHTEGENAVIDEKPGVGTADSRRVMPRDDMAIGTHSAGENAVIDERPGLDDEVRYAPEGTSPIRPHTEGENAVIDEKPGVD